MKAVLLERTEGKPGQVYYPVKVQQIPDPVLGSNTRIVVKILAAALNHRDLFQRQNLYGGIDPTVPLCADGVGIVTQASGSDSQYRGKRVLICPGIGWESAPDGPEGKYLILGGTKGMPGGTLSEYIGLPEGQVVDCPEYLTNDEAAALPLAGLTAWRAVFTKGKVTRGTRLLITGIGGGVALIALQLAVAAGAEVYVTSGSQEKIDKAVRLGAKGGVLYTDAKGWGKQLQQVIPSKQLDVVVDSAGGNTVEIVTSLLRVGGIISCYGMTLLKGALVPMTTVLKNIEFKGSTMGSKAEFRDMIRFCEQHRIKPVVEYVFNGLDKADDAFTVMKQSSQFGKIVVRVAAEDGARL